MYLPLKDFLVRQGYKVRSEVRGCDVVAEKDGDIVVMEMKRHLSVALLAQAAVRQKSVESVYVVVPHPGNKTKSKDWRQVVYLLRRLELGLVLVKLSAPQVELSVASEPKDRVVGGAVEIVHHPVPFERRRRKSERVAIIREIEGRSDDYNRGGSNRQTIVTAYRENAVMIACVLSALGPSAPAKLRSLGTGPKTLAILSDNFYGWFERIARGMYGLTTKGREEAPRFEALWERYSANNHQIKDTQ